MQKKLKKILFDFQIIAFELVALNTRSYWEKILFIGCQYLKKQSQDFTYYYNKYFWADFFSQRSKNMTKILLCRLKQSRAPFNMLTLHRCSETQLFRKLSNTTFCTLWFQKEMASDPHLLFQSILKLCKLRKCRKSFRKYLLILR